MRWIGHVLPKMASLMPASPDSQPRQLTSTIGRIDLELRQAGLQLRRKVQKLGATLPNGMLCTHRHNSPGR